MRLSHDFTICATPPAANYLMLTARGAFADVEGYWPQTKARSCVNISLEKWLQTTEGQDQKITIQKRGLLYPFGHRVIYVKDTNRKIHEQDGALYAVEKTTYYLVIRTIDYQAARLRDGEVDRSFQLPFRELTVVAARLSEPRRAHDDPKIEAVSAVQGRVLGHPLRFGMGVHPRRLRLGRQPGPLQASGVLRSGYATWSRA